MICRQCLPRTPAHVGGRPHFSPTLLLPPPAARHPFSASRKSLDSSPALPNTQTPPLATPSLSAGGAPLKSSPAHRSSCPAGTLLSGLNYFKNQDDPVAMPDDQYPGWLWTVLDREKEDGVGTDGGDEFSKSKNQRRLAAKKARLREEAALAAGDVEALAPKIPLSHQSINMPGTEGADIADNVRASQARETLRRAMRKERLNQIREANYLSTI